MRRRDLLRAVAAAPLLAGPAGAAAQTDGTDIRTPIPLAERMRDAILPRHRVLSYYGFPTNQDMGILGEHDKETLLGLLREQAAAYETVDESRSVKLAFELIASVAQSDPMADGSYLAYTPRDFVDEYTSFTADNDVLLFLDMQFGRRTVQDEIEAVLEWLEEPHVHLALDPEWAMDEGEVPGETFGNIDASEVTYAQEFLADLSLRRGLPPKMLVIHQFNFETISNRERIKPVPGVQLVLDIDGWGPPEMKRDTYQAVAGDRSFEYYGFKLWYRWDEPLMTEAEVLALDPSPDLIIYQ
jgi:hypothetical protein